MIDAFYTIYGYGVSIHQSKILLQPCWRYFMQKKHELKVVMKTCETQIMINFYSASLTA